MYIKMEHPTLAWREVCVYSFPVAHAPLGLVIARSKEGDRPNGGFTVSQRRPLLINSPVPSLSSPLSLPSDSLPLRSLCICLDSSVRSLGHGSWMLQARGASPARVQRSLSHELVPSRPSTSRPGMSSTAHEA